MSQHAPLCDPCKLGVKHYMRLIAWPYYYSTQQFYSQLVCRSGIYKRLLLHNINSRPSVQNRCAEDIASYLHSQYVCGSYNVRGAILTE